MPDFRINTTAPRPELDAAWLATLPWRQETEAALSKRYG
jgi:hypothetical protein